MILGIGIGIVCLLILEIILFIVAGRKMPVDVDDGGCLFCERQYGRMYYSRIEDCHFHMKCLRKHLNGPETEKIRKEFGISER